MWGVWLLISYLIGAIPFGYWLAKKVKKIDIRTVGSGNMGTANIGRVLGSRYAALTLCFDTAKGFFPVVLIPWIYPVASPWFAIGLAVAAVLGHTRSVFLRFQGGKAVATGLGTLLGLAFPVALMAVLFFGLTVWFTRYISLGSMAAAVAVPFWLYMFRQPPAYLMYGSVLGAYVCWRHRSNIARLRRGEEPQVQFFGTESTKSSHPLDPD